MNTCCYQWLLFRMYLQNAIGIGCGERLVDILSGQGNFTQHLGSRRKSDLMLVSRVSFKEYSVVRLLSLSWHISSFFVFCKLRMAGGPQCMNGWNCSLFFLNFAL